VGLCSCSQKTSGSVGSVEAVKEKVPEKSTHPFDTGQFLAARETEGGKVLPTEQYSHDLDPDQCFMAQPYRMPVYSREGICDSRVRLSKS
jgi:hypothetical protein